LAKTGWLSGFSRATLIDMRATATRLESFYATRLGQAARDMAARRLQTVWPDLSGKNVLGFGYGWPYLQPYEATANRVVLAMPDEQGAIAHPGKRGVATLLCEERALPFSDASFDNILAIHAIEDASSARVLLSELYRVCRPEGRIVVIAANRAGIWSRAESLPFGSGRPFSRRQLRLVLSQVGFQPTVSSNALYIPPLKGLAKPKFSMTVERFGETVWPGFSGLVLVEAIKRLYATPDNGQAQKVARPVFGGAPVMNRTNRDHV